MQSTVTPKQVAAAIGVSESSLKRWCDQGLISTVRTAGGHRRLALGEVVRFLREAKHELVRPELLNLPSNTGRGHTILTRAREQMRDALLAGDEEQCRRIVLDLHLAGQSVQQIGDDVLAEAFRDIGDRWSCGEAEVYQERRACEICQHAMAELRSMIPQPSTQAPHAIGATPECDPYTIPTMLAEIVLRQAGWQAQSLGSRLPFATLAVAVEASRPRLFWLSVSYINDEPKFINEFRTFYERVRSITAVVIGGNALTPSVRRQLEFSAHGDNLRHLLAFAQTLSPPQAQESTATKVTAARTTKSDSSAQRPAMRQRASRKARS